MRRAQSVRNYPRQSLALASDDLGVLREPGESDEDVLRKQLLERDREVERLATQVQQLQTMLLERPPIEHIQELKKEHKNLELLLQGTQRENERCMADLDRAKTREKLLERKLCELAGENWQSSLDIPPAAGTIGIGSRSGILGHQRSATISSGSPLHTSTFSGFHHPRAPPSPSPFRGNANPTQSQTDDQSGNRSIDADVQHQKQQAMAAKLEQIKLLVLGMDQRLQTRQETLAKTVEKAENATKKFETVRKELPVAIDVN
ncbi:hypothetical protein FA15DRAFT_672706 [Coprinopsis marcescibilis]|uniref:Uncharacterized protein n=1 Tax=Coprinopsis marcescibilis TaxID=230819 RepID=A0A5C3KLN3_COPMA|nr:hypothetical protein FA15DRAFT_672706 [Coprinopsis marcescibilis]